VRRPSHTRRPSVYDVTVAITDEQVSIEVIDSGSGFGQGRTTDGHDHLALDGRGIALIHALTDLAIFDSINGEGGSVQLTKRLRWRQGTPQPGLAPSGELPR